MISQERSNRVYLVLTLIFVATLGMIIYVVQNKTNGIVQEFAMNRTYVAKQNLVNYLNELENAASQLAERIAGRDRFINEVKKGNRHTIKKDLSDFLFEVDIASICDSKGIMIARSYNDTYGDDVSRQQNVAAVLRTGATSSSISLLPNGTLTVGASAPVYDRGKLIGIINCKGIIYLSFAA